MVIYKMFRADKEKGTGLLIFSVINKDREEDHAVKFSTVGKRVMLDSDTILKNKSELIFSEDDLDDFQDLVSSCICILLDKKPPYTTH